MIKKTILTFSLLASSSSIFANYYLFQGQVSFNPNPSVTCTANVSARLTADSILSNGSMEIEHPDYSCTDGSYEPSSDIVYQYTIDPSSYLVTLTGSSSDIYVGSLKNQSGTYCYSVKHQNYGDYIINMCQNGISK